MPKLPIVVPLRHSLRLKLVLVSVVVEITMLALLVGNSLRLLDRSIDFHAQATVQDYGQLLDASLSLLLFTRDYASLNETMQKLVSGEESGISYIIVRDEQGMVYAVAGDFGEDFAPLVDASVKEAEQDGIFDAVSPLTLSRERVGEVSYGISLKRFLQTRQDLFQQGLLIASAEVTLTAVLLMLAGFMLTRHISELVRATRRVAGGDYSTHVPKRSLDEVGDLADNFNAMTNAIRERIQAIQNSERALFEEKERALVTLHSIGDGVITTDDGGRVELMNPVAERLTGWQSSEAAGRHLTEVFVIHNEVTGQAVEDPVSKCLRLDKVVGLANHTVLVSKDGSQYPIEDSAAPIRDRRGNILGAVLVFHDVSGARAMARQMAYQARHDALTGLVNRSEFERRLERALFTAREEGRHHALCYLDLDQFKIVNDTCGHFAGDELLRQLANLLKTKVRESDTLARLGGDEFGVLLENCPMKRVSEIAEGIRQSVKSFRFEWEDQVFEIGVSIGVVPINQKSESMAAVLSAADVACYIAKEQGRNRIHIGREGDEEHERRYGEMQLAARITSAIDKGAFEIFYQRIISLDQNPTHQHLELLVRMTSEKEGLINPMGFIPAAERFHLMPQIDRWVVSETLDFIERNAAGLDDTVLAVNLSGQSLADEDFLHFVVTRLRERGIPAGRLCFEITETAAIANLQQATRFIDELKVCGCSFSLDDFGSGLSSFAYLKNLNVDYLKIDGAFVKDMLENETDAAMVEAINQIGHIMGLRTIAEYVENEALLEAIRKLGVDFAQGYGIHRPEPLTHFLDNRA